jgi:hypothetical protein
LFAPFLSLNLDLIRLRDKYRMSDMTAGKLKKISPRTIDFWNSLENIRIPKKAES